MARILALALNPTIDMSAEAERVQPTQKVRTRNERHYPGGGGANVARVIAELGGACDLAWLSGGTTGPVFDALIAEYPIGAHRFPMEGTVRTSVVIHEQSTGFEYRFVPEGPAVSAAELGPVHALVEKFRGDYIVASGSLPRGAPADTYARIAMAARANGVRFVLDTSGPALAASLQAGGIFLLKPSMGELESFAGRKLDETEAQSLAMALVGAGKAEHIAVTMGRDGAFLARADGVHRMPPIHVKTLSAVGAGDSFVGAMVSALSENWPLEEAFRLGEAAGAAAAMTPGTELCKRGDVEAIYGQLSTP